MPNNNITKNILNQVVTVIEQLTADDYSKSLKVLSGASIGQHVRHIIDFYLCILNQENGTISYDKRLRDELIETNTTYALAKIEYIVSQTADLDWNGVVNIDTKEACNQKTMSCVGRELIYAFDHAVHHLALVKIGVEQNFNHVVLPENFGVAPSTVSYRNQCAQ